jgi:hypothetical protein
MKASSKTKTECYLSDRVISRKQGKNFGTQNPSFHKTCPLHRLYRASGEIRQAVALDEQHAKPGRYLSVSLPYRTDFCWSHEVRTCSGPTDRDESGIVFGQRGNRFATKTLRPLAHVLSNMFICSCSPGAGV